MAVSGGAERRLTAERFVIAAGTRPARPPTVEFDDKTIVDSDGLLLLDRVPASIAVVGAGVIGIEYASMFAALGAKVTVVEKRPRLLDFCDAQIIEGLQYHLRDLGVVFRLGEEVTAVDRHGEAVVTHLASGKRIASDVVVYAAGRQGETEDLDLQNAGLEANERGQIAVGPDYRTAVDHIYAAGDIVGWPALAATAMEQGRVASAHAFGEPASMSELLPIGIYTIPEISYVGRNEEELTAAAVPYEVGISRYRELARGHILGDTYGLLKLLVSPEDRTVLGVHVLGTNATEVIHIGQTLMGFAGTVDYLVDTVFNYPTLAESYKVAALDGAEPAHGGGATGGVTGSRPASSPRREGADEPRRAEAADQRCHERGDPDRRRRRPPEALRQLAGVSSSAAGPPIDFPRLAFISAAFTFASLLNDVHVGTTDLSWPIVYQSFYPDPGALEAVEQDVVAPWTRDAAKSIRRSVVSKSRRMWTLRVATPLDRTMIVRLPPAASDDVSVVDGDGGPQFATGHSSTSRETTVTYQDCGQRSLLIRIALKSPSWPFVARVTTP